MPIRRDAFHAAPTHEEVAAKIRTFLEAHRDQAYSDAEILGELGSRPDAISHPAGLHYAVQEGLEDVVRVGAIQHRRIGGVDYHMAELPEP
ncbi:MAG TPA: hypothetical protein VEY12_03590 [Thermoplasmata archaeon]|nr:hypothetical protein [Thermoplasmata archaeon]